MKLSKQFVIYCTFILTLIFATVSCFENPSDPGMGNGEEAFSHERNPGISANEFLSDSNFTELVIEIDYMPNYAPNARALDSLKVFLEQRLNKTSVTILEPTEIPSAGQNAYTANQVRDLESQHRDQFSEGETLTAYMIILGGRYSQSNALGIAYYNTSNAFFGVAYDDATSGFGAPSRYQVESTSFRHEFGHLFGLVNIDGSGTDMQTEHQDEQNGHHCDNENCLMYYAMERSDLIESFFSEEVPSLDANCIADLQANGGK